MTVRELIERLTYLTGGNLDMEVVWLDDDGKCEMTESKISPYNDSEVVLVVMPSADE